MTDPDPNNNLKSAAAYLREFARSPDARKHDSKQPKADALRECKPEILEAFLNGMNVFRIAKVFRERNVDISLPHLVRIIRQLIEEEGYHPGRRRRGAEIQVPKPKAPITYQVSEQPSARVREEDFMKQLRLARYLAGASIGSPRIREKTVEKARDVTNKRPRAKAQSRDKKSMQAELARERRRAQQSGVHKASTGRGRSEKQRSGPGR